MDLVYTTFHHIIAHVSEALKIIKQFEEVKSFYTPRKGSFEVWIKHAHNFVRFLYLTEIQIRPDTFWKMLFRFC